MKKVIVKKATISDAEDILNINITSWKKTYRNIFPSEFLNNLCIAKKDYSKSLNNVIKSIKKNDDYLVAVYNNKIVGFINYGLSKKEEYKNSGEVYSLYIDNEHTRKGIGSILFKAAIDKLNKKYNHIIVSCIKENPSNSFYVKMGCKKIGETYFVINEKKYVENLYEVN